MKNATSRHFAVLLVIGTIILCVSASSAQRKKAQTPAQPSQAAAPTAQPAQQATAPQGQAATAAAAPSLCGNQPLCYETNDFVATVTQFRVSNDPRGYKIIDAMMHFQNKTTQPISLGYVDGSGSAIDDLGNRLILNTNNGGVRGMGIVAGNNMDPKFTLPAGGGGDARFELYWGSGGKLSGVSYEMELSIREMNRVEGNQWTLGDESLVHYQGLVNGQGVAAVSMPAGSNAAGGSGTLGGGNGMAGNAASASGSYVPQQGAAVQNSVANYVPQQGNVTQASPQPVAYVAAGQPCPAGSAPANPNGMAKVQNAASSAGVQNQTANNAVGNASSAISSFTSIFGKKKQAQPAAANATAGTPCLATANAVATNPAVAPAVTPVAARTTVPATVPAAAVNPAPVASTKAAVVGAKAAAPRTQPAGTPRSAVTNATLKQPVPVVKPAAQPVVKAPAPVPPAKKPATTTAATTTTGG